MSHCGFQTKWKFLQGGHDLSFRHPWYLGHMHRPWVRTVTFLSSHNAGCLWTEANNHNIVLLKMRQPHPVPSWQGLPFSLTGGSFFTSKDAHIQEAEQLLEVYTPQRPKYSTCEVYHSTHKSLYQAAPFIVKSRCSLREIERFVLKLAKLELYVHYPHLLSYYSSPRLLCLPGGSLTIFSLSTAT